MQASGTATSGSRWMKQAALVFVAASAAAALFLFVLIATDPGDNVTLFESFGRLEANGQRTITGSIRMRDSALAELEFELLGGDGEVVGTASASLTDVAAGQLWQFEVPVLVPDAVRYRVKRLTCSPTLHATEWQKRRSCFLPSGRDRPPFGGPLPRSG